MITIFQSKNQSIACLLAIGVFLLDLAFPLGFSVSLLYLLSFFIISKESERTIWIFFLLTTTFTVLDLAVFYTVDTGWMEYADVGISVFALLIAAITSIKHRNLYEKINKERENRIKSLEETLFMVSHEVRKPIAVCMGLMNMIDSGNMSKEDLEKISQHLKYSVLDMELFTRKLTTVMSADLAVENKAGSSKKKK